MSAPCYGQGALFDSTDRDCHLVARELCDTCPMFEACAKLRDETLARFGVGEGGMQGTWAGRLYGRPTMPDRNRARIAQEDAAFDDAEARRAHAAFKAGDTSEWASTGNRVYDRRLRRANRAARGRAA